MTNFDFPSSQEAKILRFKKLAELPFDSNRKCMSIVIKETTDSGSELIHVLTKGAESAILPASIKGPVEATRAAVDAFASEGLRTLVFAFKTITKEEFDEFAASLAVAKFSIVNRFRFVDKIHNINIFVATSLRMLKIDFSISTNKF